MGVGRRIERRCELRDIGGENEGPKVWYQRAVEGGLEIWTGDTK